MHYITYRLYIYIIYLFIYMYLKVLIKRIVKKYDLFKIVFNNCFL